MDNPTELKKTKSSTDAAQAKSLKTSMEQNRSKPNEPNTQKNDTTKHTAVKTSTTTTDPKQQSIYNFTPRITISELYPLCTTVKVQIISNAREIERRNLAMDNNNSIGSIRTNLRRVTHSRNEEIQRRNWALDNNNSEGYMRNQNEI